MEIRSGSEILTAAAKSPAGVPALRRLASALSKSRKSPLSICQSILQGTSTNRKLIEFFNSIPASERHYWVASLYALLMPKVRRERLSAYFTPPHLAAHALRVLETNGVKVGTHRILDPASGGAAFLVPLASKIAERCREAGEGPSRTLAQINRTLAGIEIEPELAHLSQLLLRDILQTIVAATKKKLKVSVKQKDSLQLRPQPVFDAVIANPPYGRVLQPTDDLLNSFAEVITDGYVNLYALFVKQALGWAKPDGLVCMILPMSFLGGPYFSSLRKYILSNASIISLDPIEQRSELFMDVLCDVCVLTLRKSASDAQQPAPTSSLLSLQTQPSLLGALDVPPIPSGRLWALPNGSHAESFFDSGYESLQSFGYSVKTGYFVWNREKERYSTGVAPKRGEVPLYWAHNVRPNELAKPIAEYDAQDGSLFGFVRIASSSSAVVNSDAIILQRTSNSRQKRRLIAGIIRKRAVPGCNGFLSENHTILIVPTPGAKQTVTIKVLCRLLNSEAVDSRFRRISGTVSVSVSGLRAIPLPLTAHVNKAFADDRDSDRAAILAYRWSECDIANTPSVGTKGGAH